MTRNFTVYVDGGCRKNGYHGAYGAAAAIFKDRNGNFIEGWTRELPSNQIPAPTNQRAEIIAIILAQQKTIAKFRELVGSRRLHVRIYSDSRYAVRCMTDWVYEWRRNGWQNSRGVEVVNRDLIEQADDLDTTLNQLGRVEYIWIPREENREADAACNEVMDGM